MISIPSSYIQLTTPSYYFTNADDFDPTLLFTDTNALLYYAVVRYDNVDNVFKLITNGKLDGYNNNTNYSYRFNFDKYIKIVQDRDPNIIKVNDEQQYFDSNDSCNLFFIMETYDFIASGSAYYTVKSNGEIWITNLGGLGGYKFNYLFYDKQNDSFSTPSVDKFYQNSYIPMTLNNFSSTVSSKGLESENLLINSKARDWGDNTVSSTKTLKSTETGFRRFQQSGGNNVSLFCFGQDLTKKLIYGQSFSTSLTVRSNESCNIVLTIRSPDQSETLWSGRIPVIANTWKKFYVDSMTVTNKTTGGVLFLLIVESTNTILDIKDLKIEQSPIHTNWTPAATNVTPFLVGSYSYATLTAYDKDGFTTKYLECALPLSSSRTWLQYLDSNDVKVYYQDTFNNGKFYNVEPDTCNTKYWYFKGINGNTDILYTQGNQHELSNVTKDYITIDNKKYNHNINTQKQLKVNTGFDVNETQIRSLVKSPFVMKPLNDNGTNGKNLVIGSTINSYFDAGAAGFHFWVDFEERLIPGQTYVCYVDGRTSELTLSREHTYGFEQSIISGVPFVDVYGANSVRAYHQTYYPTETVRTIKLEKGSVMTPYSKNPIDVYNRNYLKGTSNVHGNFTTKMYELGKDFKVNLNFFNPIDTFYLTYNYLGGYLIQTIQFCDADGGRPVTFFNQAIQSEPNEAGNSMILDTSLIGTRTHIKFTHSSVGSVRNVILSKGTNAYGWSLNQEEITSEYPLRVDTKRYMLDTTSFEGYNGSKLSEKNIELILTDEKISKRKSNFELGFFD